MSWTITAYSNTGLTMTDILDNPSRLANARRTTYPGPNIVTPQFLNQVHVKANFADVENIDFIAMQNGQYTYFYSVTGPATPSSTDGWIIPIAIEPVMTGAFRVNGIQNLQIMEGMTVRHHVPKSNDVYGAFVEEDPLLIPSKELEIDHVSLFSDMMSTGNGDSHMIVESYFDLPESGTNRNAEYYVDQQGQGDGVSVPEAVPVNDYTFVAMDNPERTGSIHLTPGTQYFNYDMQKVKDGVKSVRSLGDEKGIIHAYRVPKAAVSDIYQDSDGTITSIFGKKTDANSGITYEYANVQNKRVLYGDLNQYVIISTANGNSTTYKPEDIYDSGKASPDVTMVADVRPEGKPFFRFKTFKGATDNFFLNAVEGMEWSNSPIAYYESSGNWMDKVKHRASEEFMKRNYEQETLKNKATGATDFLSTAAQTLNPFNLVMANKSNNFLGGFEGNTGSASLGLNAGISMVQQGMQHGWTQEALNRAYQQNTYNEMLSYIGATRINAISIDFARSNSLRDFRGNGCEVYRYRLSNFDVQKLDKVLTIYGYKDTKILESSDFTNRSKFNYVMATGVQIGGDLPLWLRTAIAQKLSSGVRVWHQLPDKTAYTDGSNV